METTARAWLQLGLKVGRERLSIFATGRMQYRSENDAYCPLTLVMYMSPATSTAIVRCSRAYYRIVWAALTFMTHLPQLPKQSTLQPCVMQVVRVSGTIRKSEEEVIRRARAAILKAKREVSDEASDRLNAILGSGNKGSQAMDQGAAGQDLPEGIEDYDDDDDNSSEDEEMELDEAG